MGGLRTVTSASRSLTFKGGCLSSPFYQDCTVKPQAQNTSEHAVGLTHALTVLQSCHQKLDL